MRIKLRYEAIDGFTKTSPGHATVTGARNWAAHWVGEHPEVGSHYAVSGDGVGKITVVQGTTIAELFPNS